MSFTRKAVLALVVIATLAAFANAMSKKRDTVIDHDMEMLETQVTGLPQVRASQFSKPMHNWYVKHLNAIYQHSQLLAGFIRHTIREDMDKLKQAQAHGNKKLISQLKRHIALNVKRIESVNRARIHIRQEEIEVDRSALGRGAGVVSIPGLIGNARPQVRPQTRQPRARAPLARQPQRARRVIRRPPPPRLPRKTRLSGGRTQLPRRVIRRPSPPRRPRKTTSAGDRTQDNISRLLNRVFTREQRKFSRLNGKLNSAHQNAEAASRAAAAERKRLRAARQAHRRFARRLRQQSRKTRRTLRQSHSKATRNIRLRIRKLRRQRSKRFNARLQRRARSFNNKLKRNNAQRSAFGRLFASRIRVVGKRRQGRKARKVVRRRRGRKGRKVVRRRRGRKGRKVVRRRRGRKGRKVVRRRRGRKGRRGGRRRRGRKGRRRRRRRRRRNNNNNN